MNKKQKFEKKRAVYPELKLLHEGEQSPNNFKLSKKDFDTLNSTIRKGLSLHLYKSDFEVFYRNEQYILEITIEPSREPGYEYIVTNKKINTWLNLDTMKQEPITDERLSDFRNEFSEWAKEKKIKTPPGWIENC